MIMLSDVVAQVESAGYPRAIRFEPGYQPSMRGIANAKTYASGNWIDANTAHMICQTSWGQFQIMGDNLYNELGYAQSIWQFVDNESDQLAMFKLFLKIGHFADVAFSTLTRADLVAFANYYNGATIYSDTLTNMYHKMKNA